MDEGFEVDGMEAALGWKRTPLERGMEVAVSEIKSLGDAVEKYRRRVKEGVGRLGLSEKLQDTGRVAKRVVVPAAVVMVPVMVEGMFRGGLDIPQSIVYALGSIPLSGTWEHIEPHAVQEIVSGVAHGELGHAWEAFAKEIPKYGTEYRKVLFEALLFSFLLGRMKGVLHAKEARKESIKSGETEIRRKGEQTFILGGASSNVADVLAIENPDHTIPIFENPQGAKHIVSELEGRVSKEKPFYLSLDINPGQEGGYYKSGRWEKLHIGKDNLLKTKMGKRHLVIFGCGETPDEELNTDFKFVDLDHHELSAAAHMLEQRVDKEAGMDSVITVYLGSAKVPQINDETGEASSNLREASEKAGVSIFLDTWGLMLKKLSERLTQNHPDLSKIKFITENPGYRAIFTDACREMGIEIAVGEEADEDLPFVVYESTSDDTVNKAIQLQKRHPGRQIVALTSNVKSDRVLSERGIDSICFAGVLKAEIADIMSQLRDGKPPGQIQEEIDKKLALSTQT